MHRALSILSSARFDAPLPCELALCQIRAKSGLDFSRARARVGFARGHLLEVVVYLPGGNGNAGESEAAEDLVQLALGAEIFERWIGGVLATPTVRGGLLTVLNESAEERAAQPIELLLDSVRAAIAGLRLGLVEPSFGHGTDTDDWFAFELSPERACDYAAQDDLVFCSTRVPEPKKCFLRGEPFFSGRFTTSGALFTYLKYDTSLTSAEARLAERSKFERLIQRLLNERDGAMVGFGLGLRYGYIDLLLADPDCARQRLLPELRTLGISKRSWLLFCDSELELEYLPVHADSPEPFAGDSSLE
ncbi:MAG TPA: hypothetical protein VFK05_34380 [Polyangiaceae bacterium]|nr:hypothetical protein [Polyangiaceae bacterium]